MTPDKIRYEEAASKRRTDFIIKLVIFAIFIVASAVAIFFSLDKPVYILIEAVAIIWFAFSLYKMIKESNPVSLFAPEYEGTVVKIYAQTDQKRPANPISEIYVAANDGKLYTVSSLPIEAARVYREGDKVLHIKGTLCPVITSRRLEYHPCPICGKNNRAGTTKRCERCST